MRPDVTSGSTTFFMSRKSLQELKLSVPHATIPDSILLPEAILPARSPKIPPALKKRAAQIQIILMDVDGTITDGSVTLLSQPDGSALEIKTFDAHDGQGMTLAHTAGIRTGVITGRGSAALRRRCHELSIEFVYEKQGH